MRIAFLTTIMYPSRLANRVHVLAMCRAFIEQGVAVDLYAREVVFSSKDRLEALTIINQPVRSALYVALRYVLALRETAYDAWYIREPRLLLWLLLWSQMLLVAKPKLVYEIHDMPHDRLGAMALRWLLRLDSYEVIVITKGLATDLRKQFPIPVSHLTVLPDGVDLSMFAENIPAATARAATKLPANGPLVVYTGNLFAWKGVRALVDAAKVTPEITYVLVGGKEDDIAALKRYAGQTDNVIFSGYQPHEGIPQYLQAADVLVLPNSGERAISERYTSPLKLFEYMAAGRPVVASDLPSIREIITDQKTGYLTTPDDPVALAATLRSVLADPQAVSVATAAKSSVQAYTWQRRARAIIDLLIKNT